MSRHEKTFHQFPLDDVPFHNFSDVGFAPDPVPDSFRINDDTWTILTVIQTSGLVGTDATFESEPPDFLLEERVEFHRSVVGATTPRVFFWSLINTYKNMMPQLTHGCVFSPISLRNTKNNSTGRFFLVSSVMRKNGGMRHEHLAEAEIGMRRVAPARGAECPLICMVFGPPA